MHEPLGVWRVYVHVLLHTRGFLERRLKRNVLAITPKHSSLVLYPNAQGPTTSIRFAPPQFLVCMLGMTAFKAKLKKYLRVVLEFSLCFNNL